MVIDYSRWDNLTLSDDEDEEPSAVALSHGGDNDEEPPAVAPSHGEGVHRSPATQQTASTPGLSERQVASIPKIILLVHSKIRDRILEQMLRNDLKYAGKFGPYGISLPGAFLFSGSIQMVSFFPGFGYDRQCQIGASLLSMTTGEYMAIIGSEERNRGFMPGVPYDAQFRGDPLSPGESVLHVRYGQETQPLYQKVPGPEFMKCKMGPLCGGPVVLFQTKLQRYGFPENYLVENIDAGESDIPDVVTELLAKAAYPY